MKIKTELETVNMNSLESVYYANSQQEMKEVFNKLIIGCVQSLTSSTLINIKLSNGSFISGNTEKSMLIENNTTFLTINSEDPIFIDNQLVIPSVIPLDVSIIPQLIDDFLPELSQIKMAQGNNSISTQINYLENLIDLTSKISVEIDLDFNRKFSPGERLQWIKNIRKSQISFSTEKNKLKSLIIAVENNSSKQAEYLNGIQRKFASKAIIRTDNINLSILEIINKFKNQIKSFDKNLQKDSIIFEKINDSDIPKSILSLQNPFEQFSEWDFSVLDSIEDIYSLLICFGFSGYPVKFRSGDAVQMDSYQTECIFIEKCEIDSCSLMLANQMNRKICSHSRNEITDILILVNPLTPNLSLFGMNSVIYEYLCSIVLCRDLYMYHKDMTMSMHSHSLIKTLESENKVSIDLAIRIVYSIRKIWDQDNYKSKVNKELFNHWFLEWNTITQSQEDNCNHPVQLILYFAALNDSKINIENYQVPLINYLNEVMARILKIKLKKIAKNKDDNTKQISIKLLQKYYKIEKENSPLPNPDILIVEPSIESVRENCKNWSDESNFEELKILGLTNGISNFVEITLKPYLNAFFFALTLQRFLRHKNCMFSEILEKIEECGQPYPELLEFLNSNLEHIFSKNLAENLNFNTNNSEILYQNIFCQAMLNHDSESREKITEISVFEEQTLKNIIIDLRMAHYFEACKIKREQWLGMIGNVTFEQAFNSNIEGFEQICGRHTHSLNKQQFWGLVKAAKFDLEKKKIFLKKSSSTVDKCFSKV